MLAPDLPITPAFRLRAGMYTTTGPLTVNTKRTPFHRRTIEVIAFYMRQCCRKFCL